MNIIRLITIVLIIFGAFCSKATLKTGNQYFKNDTLSLNYLNTLSVATTIESNEKIKIKSDNFVFKGKLIIELNEQTYRKILSDSSSPKFCNANFISNNDDGKINNFKYIVLSDVFWGTNLLLYDLGKKENEILFVHYYILFLKTIYKKYYLGNLMNKLSDELLYVYKNSTDKYFIIFEVDYFNCSIWTLNGNDFLIPHEELSINSNILNDTNYVLVNIIKAKSCNY